MKSTEKSINLRFEPQIEESYVMGDVIKTIQVLDNLISNALKFSPFNRNIWVIVKSDIENKITIVEVKDEGPGISQEDMSKLFGKFAKLTAKPTNNENSTGLGLSIVKKLVENMKGNIWCESELGKGTSFFLSLPNYLENN